MASDHAMLSHTSYATPLRFVPQRPLPRGLAAADVRPDS